MRLNQLLLLANRFLSPGGAAAVLALFLAIAGSLLGMFTRAELTLADWRDGFANQPASGETVIVGVDQQSLAHFGGWPIERRHTATVLNRLNDFGANRIFIDFSLSKPSVAENDDALEEALQRWGRDRVALPIATLKSRPDAQGNVCEASISPLDRFGRHATIVSVDMPYDPDHRARTLGRTGFDRPAEQATAGRWLVSGKDAQPGIAGLDFGIDVRSIPYVSYSDLESGDVAAKTFAGKNVVIGMVADRVIPPVFVPRFGEISRAEFMALAAESAMTGKSYANLGFLELLAISALIVLPLGLILPRFGMLTGGAVTTLMLLATCSVAVMLRQKLGLAVHLAIPFASISLTFAFTLIAAHSSFRNIRQALLSLVEKVDFGLARLFHSGLDAIITFSPEGKILTVNQTAEELFGVRAEEILGKPLATVLPETAESLLASASGHQPGRLTTQFADGTGLRRHVDMAFNAVPSESGWVGYASIRDITEMKTRENLLSHQATHDALTGLPNRAAFERHLEATLRFASETKRPFAVFMLDLNKFKQVNDTLGHHIGDALLIEAAKRFKQSLRSSDFVARLGGDEFAVVMSPPVENDSAETMAARLSEEIAAIREIEGHSVVTGTSVGGALFPIHALNAKLLLQAADEAMYAAKRGGLGYAFAGTTSEQANGTLACSAP